MANWLGSFGRILLAVLILLVMITIHEFGHYLVGKLLKFGISEFSIGFGPAIFKHKSKKTGELFALRLIPLGGYCAFVGEDGIDEEDGKANALPADGEIFPEIADAGAADAGAADVGAADAGEAEPSAPVRSETSEIPQDAKSEGGIADMPPTQAVKGGKFTEMAPWKRILVLIAGACMNYLLALVLIILLFGTFGQSLIKVRGADITADHPEEVSLRAGDVLLAADGKSLYLTTDLAQALNGKKAGDLVTLRVAEERDGKYVEAERTVMLRCDVKVKNSAEIAVVWKALGVGIEELEDGRYYMLSTTAYRFGFFESLGRSFVYSFKIAGSIFRVLGELLTGRLGINALGGPVTTIVTTSKVATSSMQNFLEISAYIGVNLAVFNLLPIPALDGSKVVFTAIEWVRGKPISRKVEAVIHAVGFVFLLGFAILVDVLQFI